MTTRRDIRRLAMQILYQIDLRGEADLPAIVESLEEDDDAFDDHETRADAIELAEAAWSNRGEADTQAAELAPDWPTHRQPPIDRAILRLAYHEMKSGRAPVKVAINEAVELAKEYAAQGSPAFINGVLDKIAKQFGEQGQGAA
jgi:N utilization substance protein B